MSGETELKLLLALEDHQTVLEAPCLAGKEVEVLQLDNIYFDTPEFDLNNSKVALRIRKKGDRYIQTLKTRGVSVNGLSRRGEWELNGEALDLAPLSEVWPENLKSIDTARLEPVFRTDFQRTQVNLEWQGAQIELALDCGKIKSGDREETISELELELKQGPEEALQDLARVLGELADLKPGDISKAERGYQLRIN